MMRITFRAIIALQILSVTPSLFAQENPASEYIRQWPPIIAALFDLGGEHPGSPVDGTERRLKQPKSTATKWHSYVLASDKQPPVESFQYFENAVGQDDIIRARFEDKSFLIETSQSAGAMTILITPKNSDAPPIETLTKATYPLFAENLTTIREEGLNVVVHKWPFFNQYLQSSLLSALQSGPGKTGLKAPAGVQDFKLKGPNLTEWYKSTAAQIPPNIAELLEKSVLGEHEEVWYRNVFLWTDGKKVGLFFAKVQYGDPAYLYLGHAGNWF